MKKYYITFCFLLCFGALSATEKTAHELFRELKFEYNHNNAKQVIYYGEKLLQSYPSSPFVHETLYYLARCYAKNANLLKANEVLSKYLRGEGAVKFLEEALFLKFEIAKAIYHGASSRLFGKNSMPSIRVSPTHALSIFDEVITTLPRHECSAQALFYKGKILLSIEEFQESLECFDTLIRRFPKHEFAPTCYLEKGKVYINKCRSEFPDPDLLELARINRKRFEEHFPTEPRLHAADMQILEIEETLSGQLYTNGRFFERTKKRSAAAIYYSSIINRYPQTLNAERARKRLKKMRMPVISQHSAPSAQEKAREKVLAES